MTAYLFAYYADLHDLVAQQEARIRALVDALDIPGVSGSGDLAGACESILRHYRQPGMRQRVALALAAQERERLLHSGPTGGLSLVELSECLRDPTEGDRRWPEAEAILQSEHAQGEVRAILKRRADGHIDWTDRGPAGDIEWAFGVNRHRCFDVLHRAWVRTGNGVYPRAMEIHLADWLSANPTPAQYVHDPVWRELEVGLRLAGPWVLAFYGFPACAELTDVTRILMLVSVAEQAAYLRKYHKNHPNHLLMEMNGLAMAAVAWPELRESGQWLTYAAAKMVPQVRQQVYPDGAQNELTAGYHLVSLMHLDLFAQIVRGRIDVDRDFSSGLERMWEYLAGALRPDGQIPLNNDTDLVDLSHGLERVAGHYHRADWAYVASRGQRGRQPEGLPSRFFPWAGQLVSRSGWDAQAHWSFFDVGPLGVSGHQHRDKLHLSVYAAGRDLLVDSGRYWYKWDVFRQYFLGTAGHNGILINGCGQADDVETVDRPFEGAATVGDAFDYACGSFDAGFLGQEGLIVHRRAVLYLRGRCWIVVDHIRTDRPRTIQPLWHFHPDCTVERQGQDVASIDPGVGNLRITPLADWEWRVDLVKGATDPDTGRYRMWKADIVRGPDEPQVQGWYSPTYNTKLPCYCAVYRADIAQSATFAWVLTPARGTVPPVSVRTRRLGEQSLRLELGENDGQGMTVQVDLSGKLPVVSRAVTKR
jgi:hypothetical protein